MNVLTESYTSSASRVYRRPAVLVCDGLLIVATFVVALKAPSVHGPNWAWGGVLFMCAMAGLIPAHISDVVSEGHVPGGDYDRYADVGVVLFTIVWVVTFAVALTSFLHGVKAEWAWVTIGMALFLSMWIEMTRGIIEP